LGGEGLNRELHAFDVDGTLIDGNISFHFGLFLYKKKKISPFRLLYLALFYNCQKLGLVSIDRLHDQACRHLFQGVEEQRLDLLAEEFLDLKLQGLYKQNILSELQDAKSKGHLVFLLSSSPWFLVNKIGKRLGIEGAFGVKWRTNPSGRIVARENSMGGVEKGNILKTLAARLKIPLSQTVAWSDSILDLPFLQQAGIAIVVNPDRQLVREAKLQGWKIQ
jgi:HAD superfamily hydrolase (TIGR01490 family)